MRTSRSGIKKSTNAKSYVRVTTINSIYDSFKPYYDKCIALHFIAKIIRAYKKTIDRYFISRHCDIILEFVLVYNTPLSTYSYFLVDNFDILTTFTVSLENVIVV